MARSSPSVAAQIKDDGTSKPLTHAEPIRLLVIDDDELEFTCIRRLLRRSPTTRYEYEWCGDLTAAPQLLLNGDYDVCLLDYHLGALDGVTLLRDAVTAGMTKPVVMMTGQADPAVDLEAMHAGATDFVCKDKMELSLVERVLRYAIQRWKTLDQLHNEMTQRKRAESALLHERKMESLGQLSAGIAHEINTPAQFIGDGAEFLGEGIAAYREVLAGYRSFFAPGGSVELAASDRERIEALEEAADLEFFEKELDSTLTGVKDGIARITSIVASMKSFARKDSYPTPYDINTAVRDTLVVCSNVYKSVADVTTEFGVLPLLTCNPGELGQLFSALIVNATHAIQDRFEDSESDRGRIVIRTRHDEARTEIVIEIEDSGVGIEPDVIDRIFDPLFTTKEVGRGAGQGLAIAYGIAEAHRGRIEVETEPGRGSTFRLRLPISKDT